MSKLSHLGPEGEARMVDVSGKPASARMAVAAGAIRMTKEALALVRAGNGPKGDVLGPARIAGILAAKKTADLIPLCHPLALDFVGVAFEIDEAAGEIRVRAEARAGQRTGVEMEALTAACVALLTIYDMVKSADRAMTITGVRLLEKTGGARGDYRADTNG